MKDLLQNEYFVSGLKCLGFNGTVLGAASAEWQLTMEQIELVLKLILLVITIGFTAYQWRKAAKKDKS